MATTQDYIEYVCEQIRGDYDVRYKKMFGEYMVYANDKPIFTVCDNTVFVKKLPCVAELLADAPTGFPYEGAKECYVLDIDDEALSRKVAAVLEENVPQPKPRKKPDSKKK